MRFCMKITVAVGRDEHKQLTNKIEALEPVVAVVAAEQVEPVVQAFAVRPTLVLSWSLLWRWL